MALSVRVGPSQGEAAYRRRHSQQSQHAEAKRKTSISPLFRAGLRAKQSGHWRKIPTVARLSQAACLSIGRHMKWRSERFHKPRNKSSLSSSSSTGIAAQRPPTTTRDSMGKGREEPVPRSSSIISQRPNGRGSPPPGPIVTASGYITYLQWPPPFPGGFRLVPAAFSPFLPGISAEILPLHSLSLAPLVCQGHSSSFP